MKINWIIPLLCLTAGFAAGFLHSDSPSETGANTTRTPGKASSPADSGPGPIAADLNASRRDEITQQLKSIGYLPSRVQRAARFSELVSSLSMVELQRAAELLKHLPLSSRNDARLIFALRFLELDPQLAAKFVQSQDDESGNFAFLFVREWQRRDPKSALGWFVQATGKGRDPVRQVQTSYALREWASSDPRAAAELVISSPANFGEDGVKAVFESWAKQDPQKALEGAIAIDNARFQQTALRIALQKWVEKDPESAFQWFQQLTDERMRNQLAEGIALGLASKDHAQSIEVIRSLPEGRVRDVALVNLAESLRRKALKAESLNLIREIPFEPGNKALQSFYQGLCFDNAGTAFSSLFQRFENATDPEERQAVERFLKDSVHLAIHRAESFANALANTPTTAASPLRLDMLERVASQWSSNDISAARKWLETLPPGEARDRAIAGVTLSWAWSAQNEASEWIDQQSPSTSRDAAVSGFVKAALGRDPAGTLARLRTMRDPTFQLSVLKEAWQNWSRRNRTAAETWLKTSSDLTAAERSALEAP